MEQPHRLLFLDFETYFDDVYSLRKMPTPNYILDPRYETIMCAVKEGMGPARVIDGPDFPAFIAGFDPAHTTTVTYNALFDNSILAWRYGFVPTRMLDAMGMARALRGHILPGASLDVVARVLKVGNKGTALVKVKGMRRAQIMTNGLWPEFKDYAVQDVELTAKIFFQLINEFPQAERRFMDLVLRCTVEPQFIVDTTLLTRHLVEVRNAKNNLLRDCGVSVDDLMSTDKFKEALEARGVTIGYKANAKGKMIPAFAKTDEFMECLGEDEDPMVQALAAARLGHKSTLEETRTEKLLSIAAQPWPTVACSMPMPLRYGGAHTHRLSGDWGLNVQNLPTARGSKGRSRLRLALKAPPGSKVITCDLGQIEARLVAWLCGASLLLQQFADNLDPYAKLAEAIFGYPVDRKIQILEGFIGKTGILGLGYGAGAAKFFNMVILMARSAGLDLKGMWTEALAQKSVDAYRTVNRPIPQGWWRLDAAIHNSWVGKAPPVAFASGMGIVAPGDPRAVIEIGHGRVTGPDGFSLNYAYPRFDAETQEYWFNYGRFPHKIYGSKMLENIIQFLARQIIRNAALRIADRGYNFKLQAHDELVFVVPDAEVDNAKQIIHSEMIRRPSWAPTLPLKADIGVGQSYGDCKS